MPTSTIRGVELVSAGTWAASTGPATITESDLTAILEASKDGLIDRAPLKFGHRSALNDVTALGDGEPAYGWVVPTHVTTGRNGAPTLVGDLVGIPSKLSEVVRHAYPRRSAEILWGARTAAGKVHAAALKGLALLGAQAPAVKGLDDVAALFAAADVPHASESDVLVVDDDGDRLALLAASMPAPDAGHVPHATPDGSDHGHTTDLGAPPMPITDDGLRKALGLSPTADLDAALAGILEAVQAITKARKTGTNLAEATPAGDPATTPTEDAPTEDTEDAPAPAEDAPATDAATDTQTVATPTGTATSEPGAEAPAPQSVTTESTTQPGADAAKAVGSEVAPGTVTLSAAVHAELVELAEQHRTDRRAKTVEAAVREGRITPAERAAYLSAMNTDEATTTALLSALAPRYPVTELGHATPAETGAGNAVDSALDHWAATGELPTTPTA